ncbi:MAG: DUF4388 domain-containing protein [Candidatus Zixiibacteriota bacterium]
MSLSGNLGTVSFPDILQLLATGKKSGILELSTSTRQKEVAFKAGNIIYASSVNSSEDLLGQMLLQRGKISKADLERAITLHRQTGRQLGTTLIDMNIFDKEEIAECLRLQMEEIVYNLFSWQEGNFVFHEGQAPKDTLFLVELNTMSVVMEGTRRIDEWMEIQKVLPPDDVLLSLAKSPKLASDEIKLSVEEFRMLALINGERTLPDLIQASPVGEFVTCRSIYKLIINNLVEVIGRRENDETEQVDEEEEILRLIFDLYNNSFYRIRAMVDSIVGENNTRFPAFSSQYRSGIMTFFPGVDPKSDLMPPFDRFLSSVRSLPAPTRYYQVMTSLSSMLGEQLEFVFQFLGERAFRDSLTNVKKEISEPLARRRELVKRFGLEDSFYQTLKRADKVVKMVRG